MDTTRPRLAGAINKLNTVPTIEWVLLEPGESNRSVWGARLDGVELLLAQISDGFGRVLRQFGVCREEYALSLHACMHAPMTFLVAGLQ